jgi:hypothetical protein
VSDFFSLLSVDYGNRVCYRRREETTARGKLDVLEKSDETRTVTERTSFLCLSLSSSLPTGGGKDVLDGLILLRYVIVM